MKSNLIFSEFKYHLKAIVFKIFSLNNTTTLCYRKLANFIAPFSKRKLDISSWKFRGDLLISLIEKYKCLKENDRVFETGTGWFHFYSIYIRIFYKVSITMFDIWDNRQWPVFKSNFKNLKLFDYSDEKIKFVLNFLNILNKSGSYADLYKKLNLDYMINKNGSISSLESNSYDLIVSFHVLEHIPTENINDVINDFYRILKPGGYCIHQIGCDDHLAHGTSLSEKNYLRYSNNIWAMLFENKVQYTNRLQMKDYLELFKNNGFNLVEKIPKFTSIKDIKISETFLNYSKEDLECGQLTVVYQK